MPAPALPVLQFVPHRPPLLMVDEVLAHSDTSVTTRLTVRDLPPFGDGAGGVPAYVGLEWMAQSISALAGLRRRELGLAPSIGLLVGTRRYSCTLPRFAHGSQLTVTATEKLSDYEDISVFECQIHDADGSLLASANLKGFLPDDIHQFLAAQL